MIENMNYQYPTDFIERTLELLKQYDKFVPKGKEHYEVTLLLNACVGLLFTLCETPYKSKLPNSVVKFHDIEKKVTICRKYDYKNKRIVEESKTLFSICKHLRNSVAHCRFKSNSSTEDIDAIIFDDYHSNSTNPNKQTFHAEIDVHVLREFLIDLADKTLLNIKSTQPAK